LESFLGLVDDKEFDLLMHAVEGQMKRLWDSPAYMSPPRPEMLLANLQWVAGDTELLGYLLVCSTNCIYNLRNQDHHLFKNLFYFVETSHTVAFCSR
jgi:hypothetical protein